MNNKGIIGALALASLVLSGVSPSASATGILASELVSGVIVQYSSGIDPIAPNGEPTGANLLRTEVTSEDLGAGLYVLKFASPIDKTVAQSWADRMIFDRRIISADLNLEVVSTAVSLKSFIVPTFEKARKASGPRSLSARAAVRSGEPEKARIRLSWSRPTNRYGATIVGYRILYSSNGGSSYQTLIGNTGNDETRIFLSDGIRAGVSYRFRVRAITNDGSGTDTIGSNSNTASARVRTAPKPVHIMSGERVGPGTVTYLSQSRSDRGGYSKSQLRYRAIATAADVESVESSLCNAYRCRFPDLLADTSYTIEVIASNPRGTSRSGDVVAVEDFYFNVQWYLSGQFGVSMPSAWKYSKGDGDKVVAVIDTGIKEHEQIEKALTRNSDGSVYGYDFVSDIGSAGDGDGEDPNPNDEGGDASGGNSYHGTHVAGIIASEHDSIGTAGVAPGIRILPIRALGSSPGTISDIVKAISWATGEKIDGIPRNLVPVSVINLSLGARESVPCTDGYARVFEAAISKGISVVVAAGNEGRQSLSFPANCPGVIAVAATQAMGDRATYSNFGDGVLLSAPGGEFSIGSTESPDSRGGIISAWVDEAELPTYRLSEGTSLAAPVVSGIVGLMYAMQPNINPEKIKSILQDSVKSFAPGSNCSITGGCGTGIINAQLALARTSSLR